VRPARFATAVVAAALAVGLVQGPAFADPVGASTVPAPTGLKVTLGADSATIAFTPPATDATITNYEWSDQGGVWVPFVPAVTTSPVTIPGIMPGQPYSVSLRAVLGDDRGAASAPVKFRIKAPRPPKPTKSVLFEIDRKVISKGDSAKVASVQAGAVLKMRNVPEGALISVVDRADASFVLGVRETSKAKMWTTDPLPPSRRLWVTVTDTSGAVVGRANFKVARAEKSFTLDVWPKSSNMGAGVPLVVTFGIPITNKAAVERALVVKSDKNFGEAGWFWVNSTKAVFRPRAYWPGNATITLDANLTSIEGARGVWGPKVQSSFKTGDQVVLKVNLKKHSMRYIRNGVEVRTLQISGGKAGWLTEAGTKVLTAHIPNKRLYNPDPVNGWDVNVRWAIRVNDNGEYIHDATWNYSIGRANTSHGCTNLRFGDMEWLWRNTKFGDVAEYTGSPAKIGTDDYLAGYWNYTWPQWKRGSALFRG
jgi:lipoprotein-anchoring transpeptidase ErfK/SrfK